LYKSIFQGLTYSIECSKSKKIIITDATANNGGNTIHFAFDFHHVNSVEIEKDQFDILKNNIDTYGIKNVTLYNDDYLNVMKTLSFCPS
jgi:tRNA/tmRNA/rRNA uracil-C5-methylase (TrmA/RlmC/RlmD family)